MLSRFSWLSESCSSRSGRNVGLLIVHSLCLRGDFDCVLHHDASCLQAGLQVFPISSSCSSEHYFRDQWVAYLLPKRPVRWSTACFSIRRTTATLRRSRSNLRPFLSFNFFFFFFFFKIYSPLGLYVLLFFTYTDINYYMIVRTEILFLDAIAIKIHS